MRNKRFIACLLVAFILIFTGCGTNLNTQSLANNNKQETPVQLANGQSLYNYENLDTLLEHSDDIIIGNIVNEEDFSNSTSKYTVEVKETLKGSLEQGDKINVYETLKGLPLNKKMIFFLEYFDSEYYPEPIYTTLGEDSVLEIVGDSVIGNKHIVKDFEKTTEFLKHIKNLPNIKKVKTKYIAKTKAKDLKELINISDYIVKLVPEEIVLAGKQVSNYKVRTIKVYQGEFNSQTLNLPSDMIIGKECIVFLKHHDGAFTLSTRQDSLLTSNDNMWEEVQQTLEGLN